MKHVCLTVLVSMLMQYVYSQQDSIAFLHAKWTEKRIAPGVRLKECRFDHTLFGANQNISVLEIKLNRKNRLDVEADPKVLKPTSAFGAAHDALAAVNGTFFDMKNGGSEDYIRMDGKMLNETKLGKTNARIFHQKAAIVFNGNKVSIVKWDGSAGWENKLAGEDVMTTGPLLVDQHVRAPMDSISFYMARHPRSAVALKGKKVLIVTVDGRNQKAAGMSLPEFASVLTWLHAEEGVNLDGGGSTTLWINHFPEGGVVNYPSDNKKMEKSALYTPGMDLDKLPADVQKWDHTGERPIANVILLNKKK